MIPASTNFSGKNRKCVYHVFSSLQGGMNSMELLGGRVVGWGGHETLLLSMAHKDRARKSLRSSVNCEWQWWLMGCRHCSAVIEISFKFPFLFTAFSLLCWRKSYAFKDKDNEIHISKTVLKIQHLPCGC